ncbi:MAG: hypothetical protein AUK63_2260, partial [bacterium P3]
IAASLRISLRHCCLKYGSTTLPRKCVTSTNKASTKLTFPMQPFNPKMAQHSPNSTEYIFVTRWRNPNIEELGEKWSSSVQKLNYRSFCTFLAPSRPLSRGCSSDKSGCFGSAFDSYITNSVIKLLIYEILFFKTFYI